MLFCQLNSASKVWLSFCFGIQKKFRHSVLKVFIKGIKTTANYFRFILELNYIDLCIWRMFLFCKAPNASINWEDFHLELFLFPQKLKFSPVLHIPNSEDWSWGKLHQTRSNLLIFSKQILTVTSDGFNKYFFTAGPKEPILQGKTSELVSKFCTGIWTGWAVGRQLRRNLFLVLNKLSTEKIVKWATGLCSVPQLLGLFGSFTHPRQNRCHLNQMTTGFCLPQRGSLQSFPFIRFKAQEKYPWKIVSSMFSSRKTCCCARREMIFTSADYNIQEWRKGRHQSCM